MLGGSRALAGIFALAALAACGSAPETLAEPLDTTTSAIIGGGPSSAERDAAVLVNERGMPACTGTMIASNLVLTARHCVTFYNENDACGVPLGRDLAADVFTVSVGAYANASQTSARATRVYVQNGGNGVCGADIALLLLDKELAGVPVAKVRFAAATKDEIGVAVGYGEPGEGRRERSDVQVLAVGPAASTWTTRSGYRFPMEVPANDFVTGEATCFGDSGGPLFDKLGQVIGVSSRGLPSDPDGCIDRPTYWTGVAAYEPLLREAATAAGHPLPAADTQRPFANTVSNDGPRKDSEDEDDDDRRARRSPATSASVGCHAPASAPAASAPWLVVLFGLVLLRPRTRT